MKFLPTIAMLFAFQLIHAQGVERWEYCQISFIIGGFNSKTSVNYDFGDRVLKGSNRNDSMKDSTGTALEFKSPVDAINYMGNQGWECFSQSTLNQLGNSTDVFYFKRRKRL